MDYYIFVNGQKEGPFDVLSFIKKVKNGSITAATQVSTSGDGPFRPASEIEELKTIIKDDSGYRAAHGEDVNLNINILINEATDTWIRKITEYTIFFAVIMLLAIGVSIGLTEIEFFADYLYITNYITSVVTFALLGFFCYYILVTKRNQDPDLKDLLSVAETSWPGLLIFSSLISVLTLPLGVNILFSIVALAAILVTLTLTIFVPFLITDHRMGLKRALKVSLEGFRKMKTKIMLVMLGIIAFNLAAGVLPILIHSQILFLGLVVIIPVSISIIAQIYDRLLA